MKNKNISQEISDTITRISLELPEAIFCGSLSLVLNNMIDRPVNDIDILTPKDYYSWKMSVFHDERKAAHGHSETSHRFMVGKDEVTCFKLLFDNGVKVDVFHNPTPTRFSQVSFNGVWINVESPQAAIDIKLKYLQNDDYVHSAYKHLRDLIEVGADKKKIIEAMDKSPVFGTAKPKAIAKLTAQLPKAKPIQFEEDDLPF